MRDSGSPSNVAVGATSTQVLAPRLGRRVAFSITNYSALIVYVNLSDTSVAVVGAGIPLYPGMTVADGSTQNVPCWQGRISAIEATGAATLAVWERVLV